MKNGKIFKIGNFQTVVEDKEVHFFLLHQICCTVTGDVNLKQIGFRQKCLILDLIGTSQMYILYMIDLLTENLIR